MKKPNRVKPRRIFHGQAIVSRKTGAPRYLSLTALPNDLDRCCSAGEIVRRVTITIDEGKWK